MKTTTLPEIVQGEIYYQRLAAAPERDSEVNKVHAVVEILKAAGWRDTCDAQWEGIEAALPELRAVLAAELVRDAERYRWLRNWTRRAYGIDSNPAFILPHVPIPTGPDQNIMRGSLAQHLDNAIDAAIERDKKGDQS